MYVEDFDSSEESVGEFGLSKYQISLKDSESSSSNHGRRVIERAVQIL